MSTQPPGPSTPARPSLRRLLITPGGLIVLCVLLALMSSLGIGRQTLVSGVGITLTSTPSIPGGTPPGKTPVPSPAQGSGTGTKGTATPTPRPTMPATPQPTQPPTATPGSTPQPVLPPQPSPTAPSGVMVRDTFARPDQPFWGSATSGQVWQGDAAQQPFFFMQGQMGVATIPLSITNANGHYNALIGPAMRDATLLFSGQINSFHRANLGAVLCWQDVNTWYKAYFDGTTLTLRRTSGGKSSILASTPFQAQANDSYTMRFQVSNGILRVRVWPTGTTEPAGWMLSVTDPNPLPAGLSGFRFDMSTGTEIHVSSFLLYSLLVGSS